MGRPLRWLLLVLLTLFALLAVNGVYLAGTSVLEAVTGEVLQGRLYVAMFLVHLLLGAAILLPLVVYGLLHARRVRSDRDRPTARAGHGLFWTASLTVGSGLALTRLDGIIDVRDPAVRSVAYWVHLITPLAVIGLFVAHRWRRPLRWRLGAWTFLAAAFAGVLLGLGARDTQQGQRESGPLAERYFYPSLARTANGSFIPAHVLQNDAYCRQCHPDIHAGWSTSAHRFSSFNNPIYRFSVRETRDTSPPGIVRSRFCAGCHDPVPFLSGRFDDPDFDEFDDPTAHAGITCTVCHAITRINSVRGNADYTIEAPAHYPFAFSRSPLLGWLNRQLVKAKPAMHKANLLKPLHRTPEFCGVCHKVHLPEELNGRKWTRGQNHYDSFVRSGFAGRGVDGFYHPSQAESGCNGCHMPLVSSDDFGARSVDDTGERVVHDHLFPGANTALPVLVGLEGAERIVRRHREFNAGAVRVDLFGIRRGQAVDAPLLAPLRPQVPTLRPGSVYLLEVVIRTLRVGHRFTEGTADSNEVWLDVTVTSGGSVIGRSGGRAQDGTVDPWSHFVNAFLLDRDGYRIDRRNPQDIVVALYDNQIPPAAADVVHYRLALPDDVVAPVTVDVRLRYRKFDTTLVQHVYGFEAGNELPILTLATDRVSFPVEALAAGVVNTPSPIADWERWNDFGIGLLRKRGAEELRQAARAFAEVERLGRPEGPLNRVRVYLEQRREEGDARQALRVAREFDPPPSPWSLLWLEAQVHRKNGRLVAAIRDFERILAGGWEQASRRRFDFSRDVRLLGELGQTLRDSAGGEQRAERERLLRRAAGAFHRVLELDPEDSASHEQLRFIYAELGELERSARHGRLSVRYADDDAGARAIAAARRRYPAADHAAGSLVICDLHRVGAPELPGVDSRSAAD